MKPVLHSDAPKGNRQPSQLPRTQISSRTVYGFPVSSNQYQLLEDSRSAESTSSKQVQDRLVDPRTTRLARQRAAREIAEQGTLKNLSSEGICSIVPPINDAQGIFDSGSCVKPVASEIHHSFFPDSLSVSPPDILES